MSHQNPSQGRKQTESTVAATNTPDRRDLQDDDGNVQHDKPKVKFSESSITALRQEGNPSAAHDFATDKTADDIDDRLELARYRTFPYQLRTRVAEQFEPRYHNEWARLRHKMRKPLAEFLGTFVALTLALSTSVTHATGHDGYADALSVNLAWGFGIMLGIYTCGGISGGHLNPAISIMLSVFRGFPWRHCYKYIIAQVFGAFVAAGVVYGLYRNTIYHIDASLLRSSTGVAFYTRPQDWITGVTAFFTEFVATAILAGVILALGDDSNAPPGAGMQAFIIGLLVFTICIGFSYNTGPTLNPARDLGPRLLTLAAGYGGEVFTDRHLWWLWGCWVAPILGSLAGAFVYDVLIFTGGESPLNYPTSRLSKPFRRVRENFASGSEKPGKIADEEKMERSG